MPWSWVDVEYSIHLVQYTPSTASTQDCMSSFHSHGYELTPECSFSFRCAFSHDRPPSVSSPWELKGKVTLSHSHVCESTNWWIESQHPARRPSTGSKYSSYLAQPWPPSSHDHGLQVHLQTRSITAPKFAPSWPPSASPNSLDHGLQVNLQTHSITASKCTSTHARLRPPSSHDHGLQVHLQSRWLRPPSSHHHGLQVRLKTR